ncbi:hypothetical protein [Mesobacillus harenae]|uniref:hypothetical protein n=1 Tax=Mesobacillus harenae TaxID=2213203 RepID=UPI00158125AA|nr:hypothetical protein [Mesobacillus harenae]
MTKRLLFSIPIGLSLVLSGCTGNGDENSEQEILETSSEESPSDERPVEETGSEFEDENFRLDEENTATTEDENL